MLQVPLGSLIREALQDARDEIAAAYASEIDPDMPDSALLKRVIRHRLDPPAPPDTSPSP